MPVLNTPKGRLNIPDGAPPGQVAAALQAAGIDPSQIDAIVQSMPTGPAPAPAAPAPPGGPSGPGVPAPIAGPPAAPPGAAPGPPSRGPRAFIPKTPEQLEAERQADEQKMLDGMSGSQKFLAGMGQSFDSLGRGGRQVWNYLTGDKKELAQLQQEEADRRETDKALLGTGMGRAGQIAGYTAQSLAPGGVALRGLRAAGAGAGAIVAAEGALGAAQGGLQATVEGESRTKNAIVGGVVGAAIPGGVAAGRAAGGTLSGLAHTVNPSLGRAATVMTATDALARRSSAKVRAEAGAKIGKLTDNIRVPLTKAMIRELQTARQSISNSIPPDLAKNLDTMLSFGPNAKLKGKQLELLRQEINAAARAAKASSDPGVAASAIKLNQIKRGIDQAQFSQMTKAQVAALKKAREQFHTGYADMNEWAASSLRAAPKGTAQAFYED